MFTEPKRIADTKSWVFCLKKESLNIFNTIEYYRSPRVKQNYKPIFYSTEHQTRDFILYELGE